MTNATGNVEVYGEVGSPTVLVTIAQHRVGSRWEEILDAAAAEFNEVGFKAARLKDIAHRLGLTARSLYHYVESKEELLYEILLDTHERGVAAVVEMMRAADGPPTARLRRLIIGWGELAHGMRYNVVERDLRFLSPAHRADITARRRTVHHIAREIVAQGILEGYFEPSLDPAVVANSVFSVLASARVRQRGGSFPPGETYDWIAEFFVRGLAPAPKSPSGVAGPGLGSDSMSDGGRSARPMGHRQPPSNAGRDFSVDAGGLGLSGLLAEPAQGARGPS